MATAVCMRAGGTSAIPTVVQALPSLNVGAGSGAVSLNLGNYFGIPGVTGQIVQLNTTLGKINIELRADAAPATVANFLSYVNAGAYANTLINRSEPGFVFQTGGYTLAGSTINIVQASDPVINEFNISNTRGTVAMAKVGPDDPLNPTPESINSATNQWFINLVDNSANLDNANGGYAVFAQVLGTGMAVADAIAALPVVNLSQDLNDDFTEVPLQNWQLNQTVYFSNLVAISSVATIPIYPVTNNGPSVLSFSLENTNVTAVSATLNGSALTISSIKGPAAITVRATDSNGNIAESTAIVSSTGLTVGPSQAAVFRVANTVAATFRWQCLPVGSKVWVDIHDVDGYTGTASAILTVPANLAVSGNQYHCIVMAVGKSTTTAAQLMTVLTVAPNVARQGGPATIAGAGAVAGTTYFAKGLPAGLKIDASTGQITGTVTAKPGIYTFTTWSQIGSVKSTVATRTFVVQPFLSVMTGSFEGLLIAPNGFPVGKIEILVGATGVFSGKLTYGGGLVSSLKGSLSLNAINSSATASISLGGGLVVALALDRNAVFTGSFTIPVSSANPQGEVDTLMGGTKVGGYSATVPAPWRGTYAMTMGDVYPFDSTSLVFPSGAGHVAVTIAPTGVMSFKGKLADGTILTGSFSTDSLATYRTLVMLYKRGGSFISGFLPFSPRDLQASAYHLASSQGLDFYWRKTPGPTDKLYPAGFNWLGLNLSVEPWTPVSDVAALATKLGLGSGRTLTLLVSCPHWTLDSNNNPVSNASAPFFSNQGADNVYSLPVTVTLPASGTTVTLTGSGTSSLTAKVNLADGSFAGTMNLAANGTTPARTVPIEGTFLQLVSPVATNTVGQGFFLLPGATKTDPTLGGLIQLSVPAAVP